MPRVAIAWPRSVNGQVVVDDVRLIIEDVPEGLTNGQILAWADSTEVFDNVLWEDEWGPGVQLRSQDAPTVTWTGPDRAPGRPEVGPEIKARVEPELLERIDAAAELAGETRAATIRRLLAEALS